MNEILADCKWFAEMHRRNNKQSGPHWSTIIRFTPLFDEAVRLQKLVSAYENDLVLLDITEKLKKAQERVQELEEEKQSSWEKWLSSMEKKWDKEDKQKWQWIPAEEFRIEKGSIYLYEDRQGQLLVGYFQSEEKLHYAKRIFSMPLP